jgi:hypothetical protein
VKFLDRLRGAAKTDEKEVVPQEPRLLGHDDPYYSVSAKDAFIDVLTKGSAVYRPGLALSYTDAAVELEQAIKVASLHCNEELKGRMLAFRDAVIELSMGGGSEEEERVARQHFTLGCRLALGTND